MPKILVSCVIDNEEKHCEVSSLCWLSDLRNHLAYKFQVPAETPIREIKIHVSPYLED
jgi:hypothetical protein